MAGAEKLYTPELLGLAVELAGYPLSPDLPLAGSARSRSCGSTLELRISLGGDGLVDVVGMQVRACAVGQAAAAIFARSAKGRSAAGIFAARDAISHWLAEGGETPDWPGIEILKPARDYPGRHGAMMLPWNAAGEALCSVPTDG